MKWNIDPSSRERFCLRGCINEPGSAFNLGLVNRAGPPMESCHGTKAITGWARLLPVLLILCPAATGCVLDYGLDNRLEMTPGIHSIEGLNTPYDDFNVAAPPPPLHYVIPLAFASNAHQHGAEFDIVEGHLEILQSPYHQRRDQGPGPPMIQARRQGRFPSIPELPGNQRGPTALLTERTAAVSYVPPRKHTDPHAIALTQRSAPAVWMEETNAQDVVWVFDSDHEGNRNLYFVDEKGEARPFFGNTAKSDEAYLTYDYRRHQLYFSSNRSGRYRIYRFDNPDGNTDFRAWLGDKTLAGLIEPVDEWAEHGDTLAPHVAGDLLVFASDRHGQFDLFVTRFRGGRWQSPRNLQQFLPEGVSLNTKADEFRPLLLKRWFFDQGELYYPWRLLLFSSNRPGGSGGYDLYLTALPETL
ncbi:TolB family protein [Ectothiorhodospira variabilis]|uniref:TolB family protein n=1 Tax=Ectothiorhodospira variabilis TaxID=505694 RepID=UPI001EFB36F7|nr:hypothetical protein [Ectothiorhodospira variabilis]MCG5494930.1 hypothetical protein [Ectothiorhodospira variabilis]MCG5504443.1 hypothetical protein [Ectothiorhodospira variabilis]MCG5507598.1 hypothetical protein [Ectothiorhodospira variabilis]